MRISPTSIWSKCENCGNPNKRGYKWNKPMMEVIMPLSFKEEVKGKEYFRNSKRPYSMKITKEKKCQNLCKSCYNKQQYLLSNSVQIVNKILTGRFYDAKIENGSNSQNG